jgi:hypothetical protein
MHCLNKGYTNDEMLNDAAHAHNCGVVRPTTVASRKLLHLRHCLIDGDAGNGQNQRG